MGKYLWTMLFAFFFLPLMAFAQEVPPVGDPNQDFLGLLIQSIGGVKGMSALAIAGLVVQILLKFLNTSWFGKIFSSLDGSIKLLIVAGLGLVGGVIALMLPPVSLTLGAALVHSTTMTAFMVFLNQVYQKWLAPKAP